MVVSLTRTEKFNLKLTDRIFLFEHKRITIKIRLFLDLYN